MADVKIPGVGTVPKKGVAVGLGVLAVILGVAYYRHSKNKAAAPAATDTSQDPNAIDPATGLTYGEEAAGIQAGDLAGAGTPYGDTSGIVGYDAQGNPVYADQVGYGPAPSFVSNGAWSQAAEQYLVSTTGADAGTVAAALGAYIEGQPLTQAQASVVQQAIAFFGQPPQAGSNGYPPSLKMVGPSGSGTPPPPPGKTPPPGGKTPAQVTGLHATSSTRNSIGLAWNKSAGAASYQVRVTYQSQVIQAHDTSGTSYTVSGLSPNRTYGLHVVAINGSKQAPEASISQKTKS